MRSVPALTAGLLLLGGPIALAEDAPPAAADRAAPGPRPGPARDRRDMSKQRVDPDNDARGKAAHPGDQARAHAEIANDHAELRHDPAGPRRPTVERHGDGQELADDGRPLARDRREGNTAAVKPAVKPVAKRDLADIAADRKALEKDGAAAAKHGRKVDSDRADLRRNLRDARGDRRAAGEDRKDPREDHRDLRQDRRALRDDRRDSPRERLARP